MKNGKKEHFGRTSYNDMGKKQEKTNYMICVII